MSGVFQDIFRGKRVFLTGHTGFKGTWLSLWLLELGAELWGYALAPNTQPSMFEQCALQAKMQSQLADINDPTSLLKSMREYVPDIVIHMAAQPLVRYSYQHPVETFQTNVLGTVHVLEAVRQCSSVKACLVVTSDKCYDNHEWAYAYRETDAMGGHDPYSASKGAAELVTASYRKSFLGSISLASGRAGNVIGGGDWALDRIVPDCVRALMKDQAVPVRNPGAIRPWQHVLEPLSGYLCLLMHQLQDAQRYAEAWNFGPAASSQVPVSSVVTGVIKHWGKGAWDDLSQQTKPHEAAFLRLDCSKAHQYLHWLPVLEMDECLALTVDWYKAAHAQGQNFNALAYTQQQIRHYVGLAKSRKVSWAT